MSSVCPSVAKYICIFPGSSTPYTCYTLVCSGFHRRSTQIPGWVFTNIWETLFTLLPWSAIAHSTVSPFARSFSVSPEIQFVVRDLSIFGTTLFTVFFDRVHSGYGLIRLPWRIVKKKIYIYIYIYISSGTQGRPQLDWQPTATNLHGQVFQILLIAQLTLSPPAFYVYRRLGAAVLQLNFPLEAFFFYRLVQSCRRVVACFSTSTVRQAPFGCRCSSGTVPFLYLFIFFIYSVSPVCPFLPLLFASGLRSEKRLFCFLLSHSYALRYKRYTFFRPGFEGVLPSPPRLAAILAWLSSHIVRAYYLFPF